MKYPLIWFVKAWRRFLSPLYGDVCRYYPSCSAYGLRSLEVHGAIKGSWLTISRIVRCNPWAAGGMDYVPGTPEARRRVPPGPPSKDVMHDELADPVAAVRHR